MTLSVDFCALKNNFLTQHAECHLAGSGQRRLEEMTAGASGMAFPTQASSSA